MKPAKAVFDKKTVYQNVDTGEVTYDRDMAFDWFRSGTDVKLWFEHNPSRYIFWNH